MRSLSITKIPFTQKCTWRDELLFRSSKQSEKNGTPSMAKRMWWVDDRMMAGAFDPEELSGPSSRLCLHLAHMNITSQMSYAEPLGIIFLSVMSLPTTKMLEATTIAVILGDGKGLTTAGKVVGILVASDRVTIVNDIATEIPYERLNRQPVEVQCARVLKSPALSAAPKHNINMMFAD